MGDAPRPQEPTVDLGRALAILHAVEAYPSAARLQQAQHLCGDNEILLAQVVGLLHAHTAHRPSTETQELRRRRGPFDRYTIVDWLGEGGMGVVYKAREDEPARTVALKLLRPGAASSAMLRRFRREADLLARLDHPAIVRVLDFGWAVTEQGREPYLAMDFVAGAPLLRTADQMRLGLRQRIALLIDVGDAIEHAHGRGVIHRDLKPENVLIERRDGRLWPRVLDFGVAAVVADTLDLTTTVHHLVGTIAYMAPEQIDGEVDVRGDVWSLAVLGYELLTGRLPIDVRDQSLGQAIERLRRDEPVPIETVDRRLRGDLAAVFAQALARDPDARYPAMGAFTADLRRWLRRQPVHARTPTWWYVTCRFVQRRRLLTALAAALLLAVVLAVQAMVGLGFADRAHVLTTATLVDQLVRTARNQSEGTADRSVILDEHEQRLRFLIDRHPDDAPLHAAIAELMRMRGDRALKAGRIEETRAWREQELALRERVLHLERTTAARLEHAVAIVQLGDLAKAQDTPTGHDRAAGLFARAHAIFRQIAAEAPSDRRALDDLGHSHLRFAELEWRRRDLAAAEVHLALARPIVDCLLREHGGAWQSHALAAELLGVTNLMPAVRRDETQRRANQLGMLEHARQRRNSQRSIAADESFASCVLATACELHAAGDHADAQALLVEGEQAIAHLLEEAPDHVEGKASLLRLLRLHADVCRARGDLRAALQMLRHAVELLDRERSRDDRERSQAIFDLENELVDTVATVAVSLPLEVMANARLVGESHLLRGTLCAYTEAHGPNTAAWPVRALLRILSGLPDERLLAADEVAAAAAADNTGWAYQLAEALLLVSHDRPRALAQLDHLATASPSPAGRDRAAREAAALRN